MKEVIFFVTLLSVLVGGGFRELYARSKIGKISNFLKKTFFAE